MSATSATSSIKAAALDLKVSQATVRRWIAEGAPAVAPGKVGRNGGAVVNVQALGRWRAAQTKTGRQLAEVSDAEFVDCVAIALWSAYYREAEGETDPVWKIAGVRRQAAALILAQAFEAIYRARFNAYPQSFPAQIAQLRAISLRLPHESI